VNLLQYLVPDNPLAAFIVVILMVLVLVWYGTLVIWSVGLSRRQRELGRCSDVGSLHTGSRDLMMRSAASSGGALIALEAEAQSIFVDYCKGVRIKPDGPVAQHIKAIFDAGWKGSRLDVAELNKHSIARLYRTHAFLRSVLAVFIIVGLLGTLIGLSSSLAQLSPLTLGGSVQSTTQLSQGLNQLLRELKSAFAPSIWGVMLTFICVLVLSSYLHIKALPIRNNLERLTLTVWVPQLFPSTSRRFLEALQLSEQHMQKSFEIARELAGFTKDIRTEVSNFHENLQTANKPLKILSQSALRLNSFVDTFSKSSAQISSFEAELKALYEQMLKQSQSFHQNVKQNIKQSADFHAEMQVAMKGQGEQIKSLMITMNSYERAYVESRSQVDARLMELLSEAKKAYSAILSQNRTLANEIGEPLRTTLRDSLSGLEKTLREGLHKEHLQIDGVISSVNDLVRSANEHAKESVEGAKKIAQSINAAIAQQTHAHNEGLRLQKDSALITQELMRHLEAASQAQSEQWLNFRQSANELTVTLKSHDGNLGSPEHTRHDKDFGSLNISRVVENKPPAADIVDAFSAITKSGVAGNVGENNTGNRRDEAQKDIESESSELGSRLLRFFSKYK
jgi:biopolymer transport protein ExbB/TolQ